MVCLFYTEAEANGPWPHLSLLVAPYRERKPFVASGVVYIIAAFFKISLRSVDDSRVSPLRRPSIGTLWSAAAFTFLPPSPNERVAPLGHIVTLLRRLLSKLRALTYNEANRT